mmetsp:Transcript_52372/g.124746  ORF Transcript_52372/g.124746 Transcript_52372/m.124746 type:complete len:209 (+) Transcript_52372:345-971(+)
MKTCKGRSSYPPRQKRTAMTARRPISRQELRARAWIPSASASTRRCKKARSCSMFSLRGDPLPPPRRFAACAAWKSQTRTRTSFWTCCASSKRRKCGKCSCGKIFGAGRRSSGGRTRRTRRISRRWRCISCESSRWRCSACARRLSRRTTPRRPHRLSAARARPPRPRTSVRQPTCPPWRVTRPTRGTPHQRRRRPRRRRSEKACGGC